MQAYIIIYKFIQIDVIYCTINWTVFLFLLFVTKCWLNWVRRIWSQAIFDYSCVSLFIDYFVTCITWYRLQLVIYFWWSLVLNYCVFNRDFKEPMPLRRYLQIQKFKYTELVIRLENFTVLIQYIYLYRREYYKSPV